MKKRTERVAELRVENPTADEEKKKENKKTYDLEIFNGPFKGFHGNVVERLEDGVVRAEVVIFENKHSHARIVRVSKRLPVEINRTIFVQYTTPMITIICACVLPTSNLHLSIFHLCSLHWSTKTDTTSPLREGIFKSTNKCFASNANFLLKILGYSLSAFHHRVF